LPKTLQTTRFNARLRVLLRGRTNVIRKHFNLKRLSAVVAVTALAVVSAVSVALADNIQNDVVASGVPASKIVTVTAGGAGATVNYNIAATNNNSTDTTGPNGEGCNAVSGSATVTPAGMPAGVTAAPTSLVFTDCSSAQSIIFTAAANTTPGTYEITVGVSDSNNPASDYNTQPAKFNLVVEAASTTPVDTTAPTSSASAANADTTTYTFGAWTNQDVTVTLTGSDTGGSGVKEVRYTKNGDTPSASVGTVYSVPFLISAEGTTTVKFVAIDNDGNVESPVNSETVKIDKTAPVISLRPADDSCSLPGLSGWCRGTQTAGFSASDLLSGLLNGQSSPWEFTKSTTTNGDAVQISSGTLDDNAGNTSNSVSAGPYKIDSGAPSVSVTGVASGGSYTLGSVPTAACTTTDTGGSGVLDQATVAVTGGTVNGVGSFTATCGGAKDIAGNPQTAPVSASYTVVYGGVSGILQPINPDNSSVFSRGRAVPVKFQLAGDPPAFTTTAWSLARVRVNCADLADELSSESVPSVTPSAVFRYDSTADQYIYNADFRDKTAGTCWKVQVTLDEGTVMDSAVFKLQK